MNRELFVFAGQSNMMGAAVFPPQIKHSPKNSYEYKHKFRRLGEPAGRFVPAEDPAGEFSYADLDAAYASDLVSDRGKSRLTDYGKNTWFCPAMSNLKDAGKKEINPFSVYSEETAKPGATLAPFIAEEWETLGGACAYAHIAKGGVSISYYFTNEMLEEYAARITAYNRENGTSYAPDRLTGRKSMPGAPEYFFEKCRDFFEDAEKRFPDDSMENRCFFWLQGESNAWDSCTEYEIQLDILWERVKAIGFTHFFCIRVDFWGEPNIYQVMKAQENFACRHDDAYMLTRAASYFPFCGHDDREWFLTPPDEEYRNCRDSFYGFANQHINEKGFSVIAKHAAPNLYRILKCKEEPILEEENIRALLDGSKIR